MGLPEGKDLTIFFMKYKEIETTYDLYDLDRDYVKVKGFQADTHSK